MNEERVRWSCRAARSAARLTLGSTRKPINAVRFVPGVSECLGAIGFSLDAKAAGPGKLEFETSLLCRVSFYVEQC
jgi:hypothetical protein